MVRAVAVDDVPGNVDVLLPAAAAATLGGAMLCRGFIAGAPEAGLLPTGGVFVRDVELLDTVLLPDSLVGDPIRLGSFGPGVGLPGITLARRPGPSVRDCLLTPLTAACTLLGLAFPETPFPAEAVFVLCLASAITCRTPEGRRNMP